MEFGFPKEQRLCSRRIINGLASEGKVLFKYPFKVYYKPGEADVPRYVVSVPKKSFKRAVWRNTLKRRTREAIRLNQTAVLGGFKADYLFVYIAREERPFEEIQAAVVDILTKSAKNAAAGLDASSAGADCRTSSAGTDCRTSSAGVAGTQAGAANDSTVSDCRTSSAEADCRTSSAGAAGMQAGAADDSTVSDCRTSSAEADCRTSSARVAGMQAGAADDSTKPSEQ